MGTHPGHTWGEKEADPDLFDVLMEQQQYPALIIWELLGKHQENSLFPFREHQQHLNVVFAALRLLWIGILLGFGNKIPIKSAATWT